MPSSLEENKEPKVISLFDEPRIISKKDMCFLLGLEHKPDLSYTSEEIKKACNRQLVIFHPDKQNGALNPVPIEKCNVMSRDLLMARDYLLDGELFVLGRGYDFLSDFIPDISFVKTLFNNPVPALVRGLDTLPEHISRIKNIVGILNMLQFNLPILIFASWHSKAKSNLAYINDSAVFLTKITPYLENIDGTNVANFLRYIKNNLQNLDIDGLKNQLETVSPDLFNFINKDNQLPELIAALKDSAQAVDELLSSAFIDDVQNAIGYWPQYVANFPTWSQLTSIYFISFLISGDSLPKLLSTLYELTRTINTYKGTYDLLLAAIPLTALTLLMFPVNLLIQLTLHIGIPASRELVVYSISLLIMTVALIPGLTDNSFKTKAFNFAESSFNLSLRFSLNLVLDTLDTVIYYLSDWSLFSGPKKSMNAAFDGFLNALRPEPKQELPPDSFFAAPKPTPLLLQDLSAHFTPN